MGKSLVQEIAEMPEAEADAILDAMSPEERRVLASWAGQSRPEQQEPEGGWSYWLIMGGRGSGKTRPAAEWVLDRIEEGLATNIGFIGRTAGDVRRIQIEGPKSGFVVCAERRGMTVRHLSAQQKLVVDGEVEVLLFSADQPNQLRGPELDTVWGDEFANWPRIVDDEGNTAFTNAQGTLRLGDHPRAVFTTTPKPIVEMRTALKDVSGKWVISRMATSDNVANLPPIYVATLREQYEGTRLWRQEFLGEFLEEVEGALWTYDRLADSRREEIPPMPFVAVAVDPSVSERGEGDECGIVSGGVGDNREFYVLRDDSMRGGVAEWAQRAVDVYRVIGAQVMICEINNGGALVTEAIHNIDPMIRVLPVRAADSKRARAEPVAQLWEQGRAHIVGVLPGLEEQLTGWSNKSKASPDRLDAMVWLGHWAMERMRVTGADLAIPQSRVNTRAPILARPDGAVATASSHDLAVAMMRRHSDPRFNMPVVPL